jgi:hypothetical protein
VERKKRGQQGEKVLVFVTSTIFLNLHLSFDIMLPNGMVWCDTVVWYGMVWYSMVWYGMVWYVMVWSGMLWYGMVWYGMVWYGMV